jgi:glycosyltransferase involved in cell wall biosynthesis
MRPIRVGIDATNLREGGGRTHLIELLRSIDPQSSSVEKVIVWGSKMTLDLLREEAWLEKRNPRALEGSLLARSLWQKLALAREARTAKCDVLLVPGGSYAAGFRPVVVMCRNMLPFDWREIRRYGVSPKSLKLILLRIAQGRAFRGADGVIFLTEYAKRAVMEAVGRPAGHSVIIPHGLSGRFENRPKTQYDIGNYSLQRPFRILYVSSIEKYKHQDRVISAFAMLLRRTRWPIVLDLIGPGKRDDVQEVLTRITKEDPTGGRIRYLGKIQYNDLDRYYRQADMGVFASSCENLPNILLEKMASGLPIACSRKGPMLELLDDGIFFDPENEEEIAASIEQLIRDPSLRARLANSAFNKAKSFDWDKCAKQTLSFLHLIASGR